MAGGVFNPIYGAPFAPTGVTSVIQFVSSVVNVSPPANCVGLYIIVDDYAANSLRFRLGAAATLGLGNLFEPGRSEAFSLSSGMTLSLLSDASTSSATLVAGTTIPVQLTWFTLT